MENNYHDGLDESNGGTDDDADEAEDIDDHSNEAWGRTLTWSLLTTHPIDGQPLFHRRRLAGLQLVK